MKKTAAQVFITCLILIQWIFLPETSYSLESEVQKKNHVQISLLSELAALSPETSEFKLALRFKLDPEWHIYWINPGDSGTIPKVRWETNSDVSFSSILWPVPEPILIAPLLNYGYEKEVILPVTVKVQKLDAKNFSVKAFASWLVCKVECIPGKADLDLTIPIEKSAKNSEVSNLIYKSLSMVPQTKSDIKLDVNQDEKNILLKIKSDNLILSSFDSFYFFPYSGSLINHAAPQEVTKEGGQIFIRLAKNESFSAMPNIVDGVLKLYRKNEPPISFEVKSDKKFLKISSSYLGILLFAFLGGIILNLMPCVFPVISIKILSFVEATKETGTKLSAHGWAYTLGVIASFFGLSGILLLLRSFGQNLGWGFQLQSPYFVLFMILLFYLIGLNLYGFFEVGERLAGVGSGLSKGKDLKSSFFTGILATLVATPCTAPFMGTALGVAIGLPTIQALLVFVFVGVGMAAPYLLLTYFPNFLSYLPKPGLWMKTFKEFLSFPMFATVIWLLWVLSFQVSGEALTYVLAFIVFMTFAIWVYKKINKNKVALALLALVFVFTAIKMVSSVGNKMFISKSHASEAWGVYSPELVEALEKENKAYFVDFTAAWCLTCQVNKKLVLNTQRIQAEFAEKNVILLKADWTNQDPVITTALEKLNRNSVPVYVLYIPKEKKEYILPEILTADIVENALSKL